MMNNVSGSFYIDMIIDGDSAQGNIRATKPLVQMYNPNGGACVPDWTTAANQPTIYPVMRSGNTNEIKKVVTDSEKWYYNSVEITFNSSGLSSAPSYVAGLFQKTTYNVIGISMPALKIVGNLANGSNMDADTIRMTGKIEASGHMLDFSSEIPISISEYTDAAYNGFINVEHGGIIDDVNSTETMSVTLYLGPAEVEQGGYTVQWRKLPSTDIFSTEKNVTLTKADIDSRNSFICEFLVDGLIVATSIIEISDETDPYFVGVNWDGPTTLHEGATITGQCVVRKTGTGETQTGWAFDVKMTKRDGSAFTPTTAPTSAGVVKLSYTDVSNAGGGIAGHILATRG